MYCVRKVTDDLTWVGGSDRRLALFEGVYDVPKGVSYNSYLLTDDKTVLFDTVDHSVDRVFLKHCPCLGEGAGCLVVQHMEPDHAATIEEVVRRYPGVRILCNQKTADMMAQFFSFDVGSVVQIVKEGDVYETGRHSFTFVMAPMVHWPEVMVTYDLTERFSSRPMRSAHLALWTAHCLPTRWIFSGIIWMRPAGTIAILWASTARR